MIDTTTLYISSVTISMIAGLVTYLFGRLDPAYRSVRDWGIAAIVIALGMMLVIVRSFVPHDLVIMTSGFLLTVGIVLTYRSFLVFLGESTSDAFGWVLMVLTVIAMIAWHYGLFDQGVRSAIVTGMIAVVMWRIVALLAFRTEQDVQASRLAAIFIYALYGLLNTARTAAAIFGVTDNVLTANTIEIAYIMGSTVLWISAMLCVIWLVVERQQSALRQLALYDPLTGALNRNALIDTFQREESRVSRAQGTFALLLIDIDFFKQFNDQHGHLLGDKILRHLVNVLRKTVRQVDSIGRYGGEEFVALLSGADSTMGKQVAERILAAVADMGYTHNDVQLSLSVSIGVAVYPHHGKSWDALISDANQALYEAKSRGRNNVVFAADISNDVQAETDEYPAGAFPAPAL